MTTTKHNIDSTIGMHRTAGEGVGLDDTRATVPGRHPRLGLATTRALHTAGSDVALEGVRGFAHGVPGSGCPIAVGAPDWGSKPTPSPSRPELVGAGLHRSAVREDDLHFARQRPWGRAGPELAVHP